MSSETVAKSVGKKLRYYFEVKRLEDGFDLSGTNAPQLNHPPLKSATLWDNIPKNSPYTVKILQVNDECVKRQRPTLQYDGLHDRALKHYFSPVDVKTRITQMHPTDGDIREDDLKRLLKRYMYKHRFILSDNTEHVDYSSGVVTPQKLVGYDQEQKKSGNHGNRKQTGRSSQQKHPTMPEWMYRNHPREGKAIKPEFVGFGVGLKSQKRKQIKGGYPVLRSVPSRRVTKGEAHRLIDIATKILVATEHVNGVQSRPTSPQRQTAPKPFETNKPLPGCTEGGKKKQRPSTAKYTWDIHGRRHVRVKDNGNDQDNSNTETKSRSYDDSFIPDWLMKQQHEREKSRPKTPEQKPSPRPPSAKYRHREPVPPPPKPTVINVPEPRDDREEVRVSEETQTADNVGIQTETRLLEEYDHTEDLVTDGPWTEYQLYVRTGDRVGAATKDDVRVTLYGEKGRTKEMLLGKSSRNKVKFQRGKEDVFLVPAHHVGKLRKIKIGHDRPELSYAWYLDGVSVYDMTDKRIYEFKCDAWLSGRDGDRQTYKDLPLDCERAFVEAYDDVRGQSYPKAGRDRRNQDNSTESKASKDDKRSLESLRGSNGDKYNSDSDSHTSFSSSSSSSSSDSRRKGRKSPVSPPRAKTPTKTRELSPPRKAEKDDFFDNKSAGPTFTFRSYSEDGQTAQEEYLSGYKAGLEASSAEQKHQHDVEDSERKKVLQGPTMHDAARTGDLERMQALIKYYPDMKQSKDEFGMTPLHVATESGRLDIVKWLTALGVNLNTETQTGYTAIHLAAMNGHLNCMIVLAAMGATLTCRSVDKQTPLHVAAMNGKLECVKWLIANRSSLSAKDQLGRSAVDLANEYQHNEVEDFIRKCIQETRDPNSSLHEMRTSRKGLDPIKEDRGRERNPESAWRDDTNPESVHGNAGSINEGRNSRNNSQMKEKRRLYEQQQKRMEETNSSFLDSIRDEAAL